MTIKEFAKREGISTQAVYQRLKKNKIRMEAVTEKGTGEITGEGQAILDRLFDPKNRQTKPIKDELIESMEQQIAQLRAEVASQSEQIKSLQEQNGSLKDDKEYLKQALDKAQNNLSDFKALLPGPDQTISAGDRKLTWRERFTGKISK